MGTATEGIFSMSILAREAGIATKRVSFKEIGDKRCLRARLGLHLPDQTK